MWFQSLGQEEPLEEGMATHSNILAWRISWTEEPGEQCEVGACLRCSHTLCGHHCPALIILKRRLCILVSAGEKPVLMGTLWGKDPC